MEAALDDIAFLANSANRIRVLETIVESSRERNEVHEQVDATRVTIGRTLRDLEEKNWIEQQGRTYTSTPLGEWVVEDMMHLIDEIEAERRLREPLEWLPIEHLTFDIRRLRDAEILLLDGSDASAVFRRIFEFHNSGDWIRGIARDAAPEFVENHWRNTVHGNTKLEMIMTPEIVDAIRNHPDAVRQLREMIELAETDFYVHDQIPFSVGIVDGEVGINLIDEQGALKGGLVTDDEAIHEWAVDRYESFREEASPLDRSAITP